MSRSSFRTLAQTGGMRDVWVGLETCAVTGQIFQAPPAPPVLSPSEIKAAAAKAKADPKAAAVAAADAAAALAAIPLKPCSLLSPESAAQLNPIVITPCKVNTAHAEVLQVAAMWVIDSITCMGDQATQQTQ